MITTPLGEIRCTLFSCDKGLIQESLSYVITEEECAARTPEMHVDKRWMITIRIAAKKSFTSHFFMNCYLNPQCVIMDDDMESDEFFVQKCWYSQQNVKLAIGCWDDHALSFFSNKLNIPKRLTDYFETGTHHTVEPDKNGITVEWPGLTKGETIKFVFAAAWVTLSGDKSNDIETWYAADPGYLPQ